MTVALSDPLPPTRFPTTRLEVPDRVHALRELTGKNLRVVSRFSGAWKFWIYDTDISDEKPITEGSTRVVLADLKDYEANWRLIQMNQVGPGVGSKQPVILNHKSTERR